MSGNGKTHRHPQAASPRYTPGATPTCTQSGVQGRRQARAIAPGSGEHPCQPTNSCQQGRAPGLQTPERASQRSRRPGAPWEVRHLFPRRLLPQPGTLPTRAALRGAEPAQLQAGLRTSAPWGRRVVRQPRGLTAHHEGHCHRGHSLAGPSPPRTSEAGGRAGGCRGGPVTQNCSQQLRGHTPRFCPRTRQPPQPGPCRKPFLSLRLPTAEGHSLEPGGHGLDPVEPDVTSAGPPSW